MTEACRNAQNAIDDAITSLTNWQATLHFDGVEGFNEPVDLFQFADHSKYKYLKKGGKNFKPLVVFNRQKFPPTKEGMAKLMGQLKISALNEGSNLIVRNKPNELCCFRCRLYYKPPTEPPAVSEGDSNSSNLDSLNHSEEPDFEDDIDPTVESVAPDDKYDEDGVRIGIRRHTMHRNRANSRSKGPGQLKNTITLLPTSDDQKCKVMLRCDIKENEFIFLRQGSGHRIHTYHPKPLEGELAARSRHLSEEMKHLIQSGGKATIGTSAMRCFIMAQQSSLCSRQTIRYVSRMPSCLTAPERNQSTGAEMIRWLRAQGADNTVGLCYCFLSSKKDISLHRHPKGRPGNNRMPIAEVENQLTYEEFLQTSHKLVGDNEEIISDNEENENQHSALRNFGSQTRRLYDDLRITTSKILLGAAWMDDDSYRQYLRYPEVLFVDSTHKTNNEGRPLLVVCGRDQNGKAFVVVRIFMPNESGAFYRWVFLKCLPLLLGTESMKRVRLIITDGDSQEFEAVEESCFQFFTKARRGRCFFHVLQKTFEKYVPYSICQTIIGKHLLNDIKSWVFTFANGNSCDTLERYEFSKALLLHKIRNDNVLKENLTDDGITRILTWLEDHVLNHEFNTCFHFKRYIRCFDEYVNNSCEAMNRSCKRSDVSARPNMSMGRSANAMLTHSKMKTSERRTSDYSRLASTPLMIDPNNHTHNKDVLKKLTLMSQHMLIDQFRQRKMYTVLRESENVFWLLRNEVVATTEVSGRFRPPSFKGIHKVSVTGDIIECNCGYKHRFGIPCRHLFAIESTYDINDIDCRWQTGYGYYAYQPEFSEVALAYKQRTEEEHNGLRLKTSLSHPDLSFPYIWSGTQYSLEEMIQFGSSNRIACWNYQEDEFPLEFLPHDDLEADGDMGMTFTQESCVDEDIVSQLTIDNSHFCAPAAASITNAQLITYFKGILPLYNTQNSRQRLMDIITDDVKLQSRSHLQNVRRRQTGNEGVEDEFISSNVPFDSSRISRQSTYHHLH